MGKYAILRIVRKLAPIYKCCRLAATTTTTTTCLNRIIFLYYYKGLIIITMRNWVMMRFLYINARSLLSDDAHYMHVSYTRAQHLSGRVIFGNIYKDIWEYAILCCATTICVLSYYVGLAHINIRYAYIGISDKCCGCFWFFVNSRKLCHYSLMIYIYEPVAWCWDN